MSDKKRGANEPEPRPIIVKKIIVEGHGGHHGGAWKVAYADFVTAMMAFFLLMWLLGATTEKQRKGLADYFTPTLVELKMASAGSSGLFGGDSMVSKENYPTTGGQGNLAITIPRDATGTKDQGGKATRAADRAKFEAVKKELEARMARKKGMDKLRRNVRFTETREGLRIDLIDEANFAMFAMGTDRLLPQARDLVSEVAGVVRGMPNPLIVRGHTDGLPYSSGQSMNNWMLSSARAEATRKTLAASGIGNDRFARIEGVADREPFAKGNAYDPRNRRMSIILGWSQGGSSGGEEPGVDEETKAAIRERDDPARVARVEATRIDMGGTGLPAGVQLLNPTAPGTSSKPGKH
ncbi:flagellar motor protein MotB [Sphingobium sp. EP60837]|uniref:flagellar motor protein MotB n=1 Tax=Sphingobium sp. EP60837 TaxID=1855519 RepID=UPI0007DCCA06|nr:flagellar motor protein MotB [Sphingobium sp. EP60837]ANI78389.1 Putative flagellar export/assembly protein LafU [Sphingobium sp. EP60837]